MKAWVIDHITFPKASEIPVYLLNLVPVPPINCFISKDQWKVTPGRYYADLDPPCITNYPNPALNILAIWPFRGNLWKEHPVCCEKQVGVSKELDRQRRWRNICKVAMEMSESTSAPSHFAKTSHSEAKGWKMANFRGKNRSRFWSWSLSPAVGPPSNTQYENSHWLPANALWTKE